MHTCLRSFVHKDSEYLALVCLMLEYQFLYNCVFKFQQISKMSQAILVNPFEKHNNPTPELLKTYQQLYGQLKNEIVKQNKQISSAQATKLKEYLQRLQDIKKMAETNRVICEKEINQLRIDAVAYKEKMKKYDDMYKNSNKEAEFKSKIAEEERLNVKFSLKRIELAKSLELIKFKKLEIEERKSPAHELFKWILVTIYSEPENKYYWNNFKEQAIEEDKGEDLRQRLGKTNALLAKEEQKVQTAKFLNNFATISKSPELAKYQKEVNTIYEIAKLFQFSIDVAQRIKEYNKKIEESRKIFLKVDEQNLDNSKKFNAITERIRVSEAYQDRLRAMQTLIGSKFDRYQSEIGSAEGFLQEMNKMGSYTLALPTEKKEDCECAVY